MLVIIIGLIIYYNIKIFRLEDKNDKLKQQEKHKRYVRHLRKTRKN